MEEGLTALAWLVLGAAVMVVFLDVRRWVQGAALASLLLLIAAGAGWMLAGVIISPGTGVSVLVGMGAAAGCYVERSDWRGAVGSYAALGVGAGLLIAGAWFALVALVALVILAAGIRAFLWVAPGSD